MDYQDITYTKEEGIATITMNRPDTRNAISPAMTESIYKAVKDAAKDDSGNSPNIHFGNPVWLSGEFPEHQRQKSHGSDKK